MALADNHTHDNHRDEVHGYFENVLSGRLVASRYVRAMVRRHFNDLERAAEDGAPIYFSEEAANHAINFCPFLSHTKGEYAGQPFVLRTWQKSIIWQLFGWRRASDHTRRFRYAFLSVARGNGKSPIAALIGNYLFIADNEPRAEIYALATKRQQAQETVFLEAKKQIESNPELAAMVTRGVSNMHIFESPYNGSRFAPEGSNYKSADGALVHGVIIDELHAWKAPMRELFDKYSTAMAKRRQPLMLIITTAGDDTSEVWQHEYDFYTAVVDGVVESDEHFAAIFEVDAADENGTPIAPLDSKFWPMANPMLNEPDSPVKISALDSMAIRARLNAADKQTFRRYHCNQRVASFYRLISADNWNTGAEALPMDELEGAAAWCGFDFGWRDDLSCISLIFPMHGRYYVLPHTFCCADGPRDLNREPWRSWADDDDVNLTITPGNTTDVDALYDKFQELNERYWIRSLAADPANCREFLTRTNNQWGVPTYKFAQNTAKYNEPTRAFVSALERGEIIHGGNPLLGWCALNVSVREDHQGYIMPAKARSQEKIDPIVASIMAFSEVMFAQKETDDFDYEPGGLLT